MPEYRVIWEIDIIADSPKEAAESALEIQRDPDSLATVFEVVSESESVTIDLDDLDPDDLGIDG